MSTIYYVFDKTNGIFSGSGVTPIDTETHGSTTLSTPNHDSNHTPVWNGSTWTLVSNAILYNPSLITKGDFMRRLTLPREVFVRQLLLDTTTELSLRAQLMTFDAWLARVEYVDVTDAVTQAGVLLLATVLDAAALLPEGVDTFTATMLSPRG
jgi:hypothetical protein